MKRVFAVGLVLLVVAGGAAAWLYQRATAAYVGFAGDEVFVELPPGTNVAGIASRLAAAGVVADSWSFRLAARWSGNERRLRAGEYRFAGAATPGQILDRLVRGDVYSRPLTIPEGLTIRETAALVEKSGIATAADFERAASNGALVSEFDPEATSLEGYLFPETYALARNAGASAVVEAMLAGFAHAFDASLRAAAVEQRLDVRALLTIASVVEKETAQAEERPIVAAVYRNRLKIGMPLQCDPTVIYAKMLAGTWRGNLSRADLLMDSPYNTYRYPGLPPGPIASPGRASIEAALHPADVPYLYFVSRNDGTHVFAASLSEHNANVNRWQRRGHR